MHIHVFQLLKIQLIIMFTFRCIYGGQYFIRQQASPTKFRTRTTNSLASPCVRAHGTHYNPLKNAMHVFVKWQTCPSNCSADRQRNVPCIWVWERCEQRKFPFNVCFTLVRDACQLHWYFSRQTSSGKVDVDFVSPFRRAVSACRAAYTSHSTYTILLALEHLFRKVGDVW